MLQTRSRSNRVRRVRREGKAENDKSLEIVWCQSEGPTGRQILLFVELPLPSDLKLLGKFHCAQLGVVVFGLLLLLCAPILVQLFASALGAFVCAQLQIVAGAGDCVHVGGRGAVLEVQFVLL